MLQNREGQHVPQATFKLRKDGEWSEVTTGDLFDGKRVVVFALPGAFTPTCSSAHLPGYERAAPALRANGIDDILCISVNDAFVMDAWGEDQGADAVRLVADGNGEFSEGMGMLVDKSDLGFGKRSWRYSMVVDDGVIEKMFIEPEVEGDPFEVSDAQTMLSYVAPEAARKPFFTMITQKGCPYCARARELLEERRLPYEFTDLDDHFGDRSLRALSGQDTTPQVWADGEHIGGSDDLARWLEAHDL